MTVAAADLMLRPADELAALVRSGELAATELVDAALQRIDALQPQVNAFVDVDHAGARAAAAAVAPGDERPFAGVPIAIKNNRAVTGLRLTTGAALSGDFRPPRDHNVTRRLRAAGFVIVGTTTLPEWGILPVTEGRRFGPTRNPWDLARTPGGSSGGSAAAVAGGMVPLASGNDGGGSLRIPAACCGLVGLKPQRGRISLAPDVGEQFLVVDGVLTRTVRETALLLDVLAGSELGDASWAPPPPEPFAVSAAREPSRLRIGVTTHMPLLEADLHPACARAAYDAARLLEGARPRRRGGGAAVAAARPARPLHARVRAGDLLVDRLRRPARGPPAAAGGHGAAELGAVDAVQRDQRRRGDRRRATGYRRSRARSRRGRRPTTRC